MRQEYMILIMMELSGLIWANVDVNESGTIGLLIALDCSLPEGKTVCAQAEIFPNQQCETFSDMWSGASLEVEGNCEGDSVVFTIRNIGSADMIAPRRLIITEDIVSFLVDDVLLNAQELKRVPLIATGKTYGAEVEQVPFHPGNSIPRAFVEGCGEEPFSYGIVNQFENNDRDPHLSESCLTIRSSYLPAELTASPIGISEEKYIESTTELEYSIGFQNSGETTIADIEVIDTLSEYLDIKSVRLTASSHFLKMSFLSDRVIKFSFPAINLLPHSNSPENSRGYLTFKVQQVPDSPSGTVITNRAMLRFNRVGLTLTEEIFHTISDNFFQTLSYSAIRAPSFKVMAFPNPFTEKTRIIIDGAEKDHYTISLFNQMGQKILEDKFSQEYILVNKNWPEGIYYARIMNSRDQFVTGKFYIRN